MEFAPIVLFVYNRPEHTQKVLTALADNILADSSSLFIYADGPKENASAEDLKKITDTRQIIRQQQWCKEVIITEAAANKGLAASITGGVTQLINQYGKLIVLEDDIVTSRFFLKYMNDALTLYEQEEQVLSIGSFNFFSTDKETGDTFFVPIPDCWGWATWKDRWQLFEPNAQLLINKLRDKNLMEEFNLGGAYHFETMLIAQMAGQVNSWAIRWQAVAYLTGKLSLYPRHSVTKNIGFDGTGTHSGEHQYDNNSIFAEEEIKLKKIPVFTHPADLEKMKLGYGQIMHPSKSFTIRSFIRKLVAKLAPPTLKNIYRRMRPAPGASPIWRGNYSSWIEAKKDCSGYENALILEKTKAAILKVKHGEAAYERDSVLFDKVQYNWPLLTILLKEAVENHNNLTVVDFGGSLGSTYFMCKSILPQNITLSWKVVEQPTYVEPGNNEISDDQLTFYPTIEEATKMGKGDILLLSSVLQYLEDPFGQIEKMLEYNFKYIIADRTAFICDEESRLTVQQVPASIYDAAYPAWFFNEREFLSAFNKHYTLVTDFDPYPGLSIPLGDEKNGYYKGFIFKSRTCDEN